MPSLNRNEKATCENCGTQTSIPNLARHNKSCFSGTLYCTQCPNFSLKYQNDLSSHFCHKHNAPKTDATCKCKLCYQMLPTFTFRQFRHQKKTHDVFLIKRTNACSEATLIEVDVENLEEELRSCQHFLVVSELELRHKVFNHATENAVATIVDKRPEHIFNNPKIAPKVN